MHKSVLFYMTHRWNDDIASRFHDVYEQAKDVVDIILFHASYITNYIPSKYKGISYTYNNQMLWDNLKHGYLDPFILYQNFFMNEGMSILSKYDYIYMYEYDQIYTGSLTELLKLIEEQDAKLIAPHVEFTYKAWMWENKYNEYFINKEKPFDKTLKACMSFARISTDIIKELLKPEHKELINSTIYELYIPTLAYNMGMKIKSINKLNNEFDWIDTLNSKTYSAVTEFKSLEEIQKIAKQYNKPMWFTRWK